MANKKIRFWDVDTQSATDILAVDNGDGTWSLGAGSGNELLHPVGVVPNLASFATPYSIGDILGGIQTIAAAVPVAGRAMRLSSVAIKDKSGLSPAFTMLFFKSTPTGGTYADNGAVTWAAGDAVLNIGAVKVLASDYYTIGGVSYANLAQLGTEGVCTATSLFALLFADAAWTAASASALSLEFNFERLQ